jgi:putative DNA primase/helicase
MADPPDDNVHPFPKQKRARKTPPPPPAQAPHGLTEQGVMRMFTDANKDRFRYNNTSKTWYIWREHRWREDTRSRAFEAVLALCRSLGDGATLNKVRFARAVEEGARVQPEFSTAAEDWDRDPWLLGTPGGVVDLKTGVLRDGRPEDLISKIAAVAPAEREDCQRWRKFLDEAFEGKADNIAFFKRMIGYFLTGLTSEESLLFICGKPGTGKGTATKTLTTMLRDYALTVPISMFMDSGWRALEYYRAKLQGRRLIVAAEPEKGSMWNDAFVNELTGGDRVSARHPAGRPFDFDPSHKVCIHGEQVPELKSVHTGLKRRLRIMPVNHTPQLPDTNLKVALQAEFGGILRWAINGCLDWQKDGMKPPHDVTAAVDDYFARQDTLARWIGECCDLYTTYRTPPGLLLQSYNTWAKNNNERLIRSNDLHEILNKKGFPTKALNGKNYVHGITIVLARGDGD